MVSLAEWQASLADAVDEAFGLVNYLRNASYDREGRARLARIATLIRTVAQIRCLDEVADLADEVAVIARGGALDIPQLVELEALVERLRALAAALLPE